MPRVNSFTPLHVSRTYLLSFLEFLTILISDRRDVLEVAHLNEVFG